MQAMAVADLWLLNDLSSCCSSLAASLVPLLPLQCACALMSTCLDPGGGLHETAASTGVLHRLLAHLQKNYGGLHGEQCWGHMGHIRSSAWDISGVVLGTYIERRRDCM